MNAQASMYTGALEADKSTELGGSPLWGGGGAVGACGITGEFLESDELNRKMI